MKAHIDNYSTWIPEVDPTQLCELCEKLLVEAGFGILNFMEHHFEPIGWTGIWLLAESHLAIHTFPEESKAYVELSSCNTEMYEAFIDRLEKHMSNG